VGPRVQGSTLSCGSLVFADMGSDLVALAGVLVLATIGKAVWHWVRPPAPGAAATEDDARRLAAQGKTIAAIRVIREVRGIPVGEARRWVEDLTH
jgi:ribosomal protein L7/L12